MANPDLKKQVQLAWDMSENDLYKHLGMASLGTKSITESIDSMKMLISTAANTDAALAAASLDETLLEKGRESFKCLWDGLKDSVCPIYRNGASIGGTKVLVTDIINILVTAGVIANPPLVMAITIAVKLGLDLLCAIPPKI